MLNLFEYHYQWLGIPKRVIKDSKVATVISLPYMLVNILIFNSIQLNGIYLCISPWNSHGAYLFALMRCEAPCSFRRVFEEKSHPCCCAIVSRGKAVSSIMLLLNSGERIPRRLCRGVSEQNPRCRAIASRGTTIQPRDTIARQRMG